MSIAGSMEIFAGPEALAQRAATLIGERMAGCEAPFRLVLAGGSTPREAYRKLAYSNALPWDCVELFFGDERFVPPSHPDSNYRMARETLLGSGTVQPRGLFAIPTDDTPDSAAARYDEILRQQYGASVLEPDVPLFNLTLLGLGGGRPHRVIAAGAAGARRTGSLGRDGAARPGRAAHHLDLSRPGIQPHHPVPGDGRRQEGRPGAGAGGRCRLARGRVETERRSDLAGG